MKKKSAHQRRWGMGKILAMVVLPAALAVIPKVRKQYGVAGFSLPSIAIMAGLWLWQRRLEKRRG